MNSIDKELKFHLFLTPSLKPMFYYKQKFLMTKHNVLLQASPNETLEQLWDIVSILSTVRDAYF